LQLPSKEPLKTDTKPPAVPPYISGSSVDNANQSLQSTEKKNASLNKTDVTHDYKLDNKQNMNDTLNDSNFTMQLVKRIEKWSPSTAKYAKLSVFGTKVSNIYLMDNKYNLFVSFLFQYLYKDILVLLSAYNKYYNSDLSLTYAELELMYRLPSQLFGLTPILIFCNIPFLDLLIFPIA